MIFCELFKQKLSITTKTPFEAASAENQDYSVYNFVMKNRALQPFMSRLIATMQIVSIQDQTAQQADNSSHTGAAKVLDNSQQYTE